MKPEQLKTLRVLVVGAGVTGVSVMRYLHRHQVSFDVADENPTVSDRVVNFLQTGQYITGLASVSTDQYDVMVLSPGIPRAHPMLQQALNSGVAVIGDVELFASVVSGDVIAITGSNGKSTVASMAAHVLKTAGRDVELCGNIGTAVLDVLPDDLADSKSATTFVLELSSYQLESVRSLTPLSATVLNISDDHLDRYASIDDYAATKRWVYQGASACVANLDDEKTHPENTDASVVWFSTTNSAAEFYVASEQGAAALVSNGESILHVTDLQVPGLHNVANALAVIALLQPLKLSAAEIKNGLSSFKGLEHRTELVSDHRGVRWYNDSKGTNVDACTKAITAMSGPVILIAGGQGKGVDFSPLRVVVSERVKAVVLIGEDAPMLRAALDGATDVHDADSMQAAVTLADKIAEPGDAVLLSPACASFDMFDNYMARGRVFRENVEQLAA